MALCPHCNKIITHLYSSATANSNAQIYEGEEDITYDDEPEWELDEWECPECGEIIASDDDEAIEFMNNKDELKKLVENKIKNG